jgi:hypothetical protein
MTNTPLDNHNGISPTRRRPQTCRALFGAAWTSPGAFRSFVTNRHG